MNGLTERRNRYREEKKYLISRISCRIDQHMKFLDAMEQVRWRFTTAFGLTSLGAILFLAYKLDSNSKANMDILLFSYGFAVLISLAGLVTQIRIIAIFWGQWHRIRELQRKEAFLLKENIYFDKGVDEVWMYPDMEAKSKTGKYFLTVHGANCMLFSALFSGSFILFIKSFGLLGGTQCLLYSSIALGLITYYGSQKLSKIFITSVKTEATQG